MTLMGKSTPIYTSSGYSEHFATRRHGDIHPERSIIDLLLKTEMWAVWFLCCHP